MSQYRELCFTVPTDALDAFTALLYDAGAPGFEERDEGTIEKVASGSTKIVVWLPPADVEPFLLAMREGAERLPEVLLELAAPTAQTDRHEDEWRDLWKKFFRTRRVGKFVLVPSWETAELKLAAGERALHIDPGRAFGTGGHASTRLVLRALDVLADRGVLEGARLFDAGCGSGVLSVAAALASPTLRGFGVDLDPEAVEVSNENATLNRVLDRLQFSTTPIEAVPGPFDLIVANIQPEVLNPLASALCGKLRPGGVLLLSGILDEVSDSVRDAYARQPVTPLELLGDDVVEDEWRLVSYTRS